MKRFIKVLRHLKALRRELIDQSQWDPPVYYDILDSHWHEIEVRMDGLITDLTLIIESARPVTAALDWQVRLQQRGGNGVQS